MFTIYHAPKLKKVGCTKDYPKRCYEQGLKDGEFSILEKIPVSKGAQLAGDREWAWAEYFGYTKREHYAEAMRKRRLAVASPNHNSRTGELQRAGVASPNHVSKTGIGTRASAASPNHISRTGALQRAAVTATNHISKRPKINPFMNGDAARAAAASPNHIKNKNFTCPHCGRSGWGLSMLRWHFDNCRKKK